jgi:septal ring factor EnvC (AmiA/AmiB activator)
MTTRRFIALLCVALSGTHSSASQVPSEPIRSLTDRLASVRGDLLQSEVELRRLLGNLYLIRSRMRRIAQEKANLEDRVAVRRSDISQLRKQIEGLELSVAKQRDKLRSRLKTLYKFSGQGFVALMLSQSSTSELDRTIRFLRDLSEEDHNAIRSYQRLLNTQRQRSERLRAELVEMAELESELERQEKALLEERDRKQELVGEVEAVLKRDQVTYRSLAARRDQLRETVQGSAELSDEILDLLAPSFMDLRGRLEWPVAGRIIRPFGLVENLETRVRFSHKGILIAPNTPGAQVRAFAPARVIQVGRVPGHGLTVVLDHGDHHYTVLARLGRVRVREGDRVNRGQSIASVGRRQDLDWNYDITSDGRSIDRPVEGLYLEIRHFAEAENPANWLKPAPPPDLLRASVDAQTARAEGTKSE